MKSLEINKNEILSNEAKEIFFNHLESNKWFFNEAIDNILTLVVSDPALTRQVADLMESNYPALYLAIINKKVAINDTNIPPCCQSPGNSN